MLRKWSLVVLIAAVLLVGLPGGVGAGPAPIPAGQTEQVFYWNRLDVDVSVLPNSDLRVVETWEMTFTQGLFSFGFRSIDVSGQESITGATVKMEGKDLVESATGEPGTFSLTRIDPQKYRVQFSFDPSEDFHRAFEIAYTVKGALQSNAASDQVAWLAIFRDHAFAIRSARVWVHLPDGADAYTSDLKSDGAPAVSRVIDKHTVEFKASAGVPSDQGITVYVSFPHGLVEDQDTSAGFGSSVTVTVPAGHIVYGQDNQIYQMNPDGSGAVDLTHDPIWAASPSWSPDGKRIAFTSNRNENSEIYAMNADGSGQTRLMNNPGIINADAAWSPTAEEIAFESTRVGNAEIYVMSPDGTGQTNLTDNRGMDRLPAWSPDGKRIAFMSDRAAHPDESSAGAEDIWVMDADGAHQTQLTSGRAAPDWTDETQAPAWSPDGQWIAYTSCQKNDREACEIFIVATDAKTLPQKLTVNAAGDWQPAWSPDGKRIAFKSDRDSNDEIYVAEVRIVSGAVTSGDVVRLTDSTTQDQRPAWSPDGQRIAFESQRDGHSEIYVVEARGSEATRLTTSKGAFAPKWVRW